jgi:hypothetical protein
MYDLVAVDPDWVAGYGGFSNRDASDMYTGTGFTQTVGATNFADEAIFLSYKIPSLAPAATGVFKFATVFDPSAVSSAVADLFSITTGMNDASFEPVHLYPNPFTESTTVLIDRSVRLDNAELKVFDLAGREVMVIGGINSHEVQLNKDGLSTGAYLYRLLNKGSQVANGKLIVK